MSARRLRGTSALAGLKSAVGNSTPHSQRDRATISEGSRLLWPGPKLRAVRPEQGRRQMLEVAEADLELGFVHPRACRIVRRARRRETIGRSGLHDARWLLGMARKRPSSIGGSGWCAHTAAGGRLIWW